MEGWKYYNHAMIPATAPHEAVNTDCIKDGSIWKQNRKALLARWTTDFDCGYETNWWYVIKDTPFDISNIKAKRRYEINKGNKYFNVCQIENPVEYAHQLCDVQIDAFSAYPEKYRPIVNREQFVSGVNSWNAENCYIYGAFSVQDNRLCGYAYLTEEDKCLNFTVLKTCPSSEKYAINAALVNKILEDNKEKLNSGGYICDGARSVVHETAFQDYLMKYFGFRKAFCKLHIDYNPRFKWIILLLYRFRWLFAKLDSFGLIHQMNGVFAMQEIVERQR